MILHVRANVPPNNGLQATRRKRCAPEAGRYCDRAEDRLMAMRPLAGLPLLAGTCLSIYVRSYIVCQIKPKLLQMRGLRLCGEPAIMTLVIHFW